ncbi:cytochrome b5 domain-containing protein [Ectothiorhodospira variabilis]|uniref:cytochrome b5 domain-containing protein n=1 Tax=Ectothiorhodospira variabilis TaxID=505694 RepID=UPI001EFB6E2D|nr:cytochrome b5-like heme/steroid binding domain-containing protein [Ectothiorhodospira variabilis]MCG5493171.1 cytochrome b5 domain-containing protein [Ectothiorhodospira variabilis]MCG5502500.1 cytochrome b5 domain-containing protein [Ectothiorhodospira variabilis]MCG5505734.1 cytochrome b5 domain-containing protein [Ectothiorhodospira variabilis]
MPSTRFVPLLSPRQWGLAAFLGTALLASPLASMADEADEALPVITQEELARHDQPEDCWKAIHGKVYDITDYLPRHPGPPAMVLHWCGQESTEAWETKGYGMPHSDAAGILLEDYLIGILEEEEASADRQQD